MQKAPERMTSKERVLRAMHREEPDRVPINYFANGGIDQRLKKYFGLEPHDGEGLMQALGVDFRGVGAPYTGPPRLHPEAEGVNVDPLWGIRTVWIEHGSGGYMDYCDFPLKDADEETVANWPMPSADDFDYSGVAEACRAQSRYAVAAGGAGSGDIINSTGFLMGTERALLTVLTDDPAGALLIDRRHDFQLAQLERILEAAKGGVDFLWLGEDLGTQIAPLISLDAFRRFIRPRHQRFVDLGKAYNLPVMIHTCGSSSWAYDDFAEMGITVVDTLQPEAANMSPRYLKERFGDRLAFHGCISTAGPVSFGTVEDVERDVCETLEIMMPGGGYLLSPTHSLQDNSPTENVVAIYETAHRCGVYTVPV